MTNLLMCAFVGSLLSLYVFVVYLFFGYTIARALYYALTVFMLVVGLSSIIVVLMEILNAVQ
jgi:hypothetical protein